MSALEDKQLNPVSHTTAALQKVHCHHVTLKCLLSSQQKVASAQEKSYFKARSDSHTQEVFVLHQVKEFRLQILSSVSSEIIHFPLEFLVVSLIAYQLDIYSQTPNRGKTLFLTVPLLPGWRKAGKWMTRDKYTSFSNKFLIHAYSYSKSLF